MKTPLPVFVMIVFIMAANHLQYKCIASASPPQDHVFEYAEDNQRCLKCHGHKYYYYYNDWVERDIKERMNPYLIIDSAMFYESNHRNFSCTDCHSEEFTTFPHPGELRMEPKFECLDCHGGDDTYAYYNFEKIDAEYGKIFGRNYGILKEYKCEDAEYIIFGLGTLMAESHLSADALRKEGYKVGVVSLKLYRPFPRDKLVEYVKKMDKVKAYAVFDRNLSYGYEGALCSDFKAALYTGNVHKPIHNYLAGIGGRDVTFNQIKDATMNTIKQIEEGKMDKEPEWINVFIEGAEK